MQQIENIYQLTKKRKVHIGFYKDDEWFVEDLDDWALQEKDTAKTSPVIKNFQTLFHQPGHTNNGANKVLCMEMLMKLKVWNSL